MQSFLVRSLAAGRAGWFALLTAAVLLAACNDGSTPDAQGGGKKNPPAEVIPQRDRTGMDTSSRPGYYPEIDTTGKADPNVRPDTTDGTITVAGTGAVEGKWVFYDATASTDEFTRAGVTTSSLQIEGHRINPVMNFKIRVMSDDGPVTAGTWKLGDSNPIRRVDVVWDNNSVYYRSIGTATGQVTVTAIDLVAVSGTYTVTLPSISATGKPQTLVGSFSMKLAK